MVLYILNVNSEIPMVTTENLKIRKKENIDIISRLPGRFGIEEELKKKATVSRCKTKE